MKRMTPEERNEIDELRADVRSLRELFEGYRDRLEAQAAERQRRRRRLNRFSLGILGRD